MDAIARAKEACPDCGATPKEWQKFDKLMIEGVERERWHCKSCDAYLVLPVGGDREAEAITLLKRALDEIKTGENLHVDIVKFLRGS